LGEEEEEEEEEEEAAAAEKVAAEKVAAEKVAYPPSLRQVACLESLHRERQRRGPQVLDPGLAGSPHSQEH
jgi:hypothetical protein